ncbi:hypothetical protein [Patulibacter minatonensis]|uniref:hypothetical protein n=1 Tax=Patulibacter minatonensis TaxID=298163 RepID=UPI0004BC116C|nr:hypothetical protein [Patulibacter minatonensis]
MPFFTLSLRTPLSLEHMPADPGVVGPTPLTIGWTGKQSHYTLAYDVADLVVTPGEPDPVIVNPPTGPGPETPGVGGSTPGPGGSVPGTTPPPSGTVRPATPPRLSVSSRVNPVNFRSTGIRVRVTLPEKARVELYATANYKKKLARRRTKTIKRTITRKRVVTLPKGTTALRIRSSALGRATVGPRSRIRATVSLKTRFTDGRLVTVTKTVLIARSTKA